MASNNLNRSDESVTVMSPSSGAKTSKSPSSPSTGLNADSVGSSLPPKPGLPPSGIDSNLGAARIRQASTPVDLKSAAAHHSRQNSRQSKISASKGSSR